MRAPVLAPAMLYGALARRRLWFVAYLPPPVAGLGARFPAGRRGGRCRPGCAARPRSCWSCSTSSPGPRSRTASGRRSTRHASPTSRPLARHATWYPNATTVADQTTRGGTRASSRGPRPEQGAACPIAADYPLQPLHVPRRAVIRSTSRNRSPTSARSGSARTRAAPGRREPASRPLRRPERGLRAYLILPARPRGPPARGRPDLRRLSQGGTRQSGLRRGVPAMRSGLAEPPRCGSSSSSPESDGSSPEAATRLPAPRASSPALAVPAFGPVISGQRPGPRRTGATSGGSENPWLPIQGYQRYLLQLGFVDQLIGRLMDRLREEHLYDRSLIVVTADHGSELPCWGQPAGREQGEPHQHRRTSPTCHCS